MRCTAVKEKRLTSPDPKDRGSDDTNADRRRKAELSVTIAGETVPKLPHERDESVDPDAVDRTQTDDGKGPNPKAPGAPKA